MLIALGYGATRTGFFPAEANAYLSKFVFYFALSAMLFRFSANLSLADVWDGRLVAAYLWGTLFVYGIATIVGYLRRQSTEVTAIRKGWVDYKNAQQQTVSVEADSVVVASGAGADPNILTQLTVGDIPTKIIGDSASLDYIEGAMATAQQAVAEL